jgi:26S proteasome regulatory subunit N10
VPRTNIVDGFDYGELGVDPNLDPELALALRVSIEEERARQAAAAVGEAAPVNEAAAATPAAAGAAGEMATVPEGEPALEAMDEDALLQEALALSMQIDQATPAVPAVPAASAAPAAPSKALEANAEEEDDAMLDVDDPELALALQMSMAEAQPEGNQDKGDGSKNDE